MRFKVSPRFDPNRWNLWFAWYPVRLENKDEVVWLDYVWAIRDWGHNGELVWKYRDKITEGE